FGKAAAMNQKTAERRQPAGNLAFVFGSLLPFGGEDVAVEPFGLVIATFAIVQKREVAFCCERSVVLCAQGSFSRFKGVLQERFGILQPSLNVVEHSKVVFQSSGFGIVWTRDLAVHLERGVKEAFGIGITLLALVEERQTVLESQRLAVFLSERS